MFDYETHAIAAAARAAADYADAVRAADAAAAARHDAYCRAADAARAADADADDDEIHEIAKFGVPHAIDTAYYAAADAVRAAHAARRAARIAIYVPNYADAARDAS